MAFLLLAVSERVEAMSSSVSLAAAEFGVVSSRDCYRLDRVIRKCMKGRMSVCMLTRLAMCACRTCEMESCISFSDATRLASYEYTEGDQQDVLLDET